MAKAISICKTLKQLVQLSGKPKTVLITTHQNPDADAMGSSLGLAGYLRKKGHHVTVITPTEYSQNLHWMSGNDGVIAFDEKLRVSVSQLLPKPMLFSVLIFRASTVFVNWHHSCGSPAPVKF